MNLLRTPLFQKHVDAGAKMVDFGGWEMPLKYSTETAEHLAVRTGVGVFDVSHMGEIFIEGKDALAAVQRLVTNDIAAIADGQCAYAGLLNERGTFVDDVIVNRFSTQKFLICVNAGNQDKDFAHMKDVLVREFPSVDIRNEGPLWAQIAVQGPKAPALVEKLAGSQVAATQGYHFFAGMLDISGRKIPALVARTGYTGEDGFELYVKNEDAAVVWDAVLAGGAVPCGLAARDTLRLESGMCLYGNDIDDAHTPLEANLGWIIKFDKGVDFVGAAALRDQKNAGVPRILRGLEMIDRGIARHGYKIFRAGDGSGDAVGEVTSGTQAPFLQKAIAMAYLRKDCAEVGNVVAVDIRGKRLQARVVKLPFYRRAKTAL